MLTALVHFHAGIPVVIDVTLDGTDYCLIVTDAGHGVHGALCRLGLRSCGPLPAGPLTAGYEADCAVPVQWTAEGYVRHLTHLRQVEHRLAA